MRSIIDIKKSEEACLVYGGEVRRVITDIETVLNHYEARIEKVSGNRVVKMSTGAELRLISASIPFFYKGLEVDTAFIFRDTLRGRASVDIWEAEYDLKMHGVKIYTFDEEFYPMETALRKKYMEEQRRRKES